jgi:hypothetical protein
LAVKPPLDSLVSIPCLIKGEKGTELSLGDAVGTPAARPLGPWSPPLGTSASGRPWLSDSDRCERAAVSFVWSASAALLKLRWAGAALLRLMTVAEVATLGSDQRRGLRRFTCGEQCNELAGDVSVGARALLTVRSKLAAAPTMVLRETRPAAASRCGTLISPAPRRAARGNKTRRMT